jgi:tetratricopeptide (TPR) repeat protein
VFARQGQPVDALRLFAEAEAAGEPMAAHAGERGLAYDLVGDNARAQQDYQLALSLGENALVSRRLALSQAIAGDQRSSEATLLPMLQRRDLAAYRARAFALAILGKSEEAVSIAETMLPERISSRLAPYLRYMPRLTRAQQAAAANLGAFPRAAEIGRDDPALAAYAPQGLSQANAPQPARTADARLVPSGEPLGPNRVANPVPQQAAPVPVQAVPAQQAPVQTAYVQTTPAPTPAPAAPPSSVPTPAPSSAVVQSTQLARAAVTQPPPASPPVAIAAATQPTLPPPAGPPSPVTAPPPAISLSEAFADFSLPPRTVAAGDGAVDITAIEPRREAPPAAKPAPPPKPVVPSRQWVKVATGRDVEALAFDWRRIKRSAGALLDKPEPHVAAWGQTNRLVVGPFGSVKEADALIAKLKEKKVDSFRFTSAKGEEVKPLD